MVYYYAQIDTNFACFAVTQTSGPINRSDMIAIDSYNVDLLGKIWSDGEWINSPS